MMAQSPAAPFKNENDLVQSFVYFLTSTNKDEFLVYCEFEAGFGRPDVVLYSAPLPESLESIQSLEKVNPRLSPLLSRDVAKKIKSHAELARACGTTPELARKIANQLTQINRIKYSKKSNEKFTINAIDKLPFRHVVSLEAKLRDWQRALTQAYRYKTFSHESWVLLDEAHVAPALKNIKRFKNLGIGLASFSSHGELRIFAKAMTQKTPSSLSLTWRTQALLARHAEVLRTDQQL